MPATATQPQGFNSPTGYIAPGDTVLLDGQPVTLITAGYGTLGYWRHVRHADGTDEHVYDQQRTFAPRWERNR